MNTPIHSRDSISTREAARIIGCTQAGVRHLIKIGRLKAYSISPRIIIVSRVSAEVYAARPKIMGRPRVAPEKILEKLS